MDTLLRPKNLSWDHLLILEWLMAHIKAPGYQNRAVTAVFLGYFWPFWANFGNFWVRGATWWPEDTVLSPKILNKECLKKKEIHNIQITSGGLLQRKFCGFSPICDVFWPHFDQFYPGGSQLVTQWHNSKSQNHHLGLFNDKRKFNEQWNICRCLTNEQIPSFVAILGVLGPFLAFYGAQGVPKRGPWGAPQLFLHRSNFDLEYFAHKESK